MANWFTKRISGLDFWDKEENQRQRDQFAREDEEERKRKAQLAATKSVSQNNTTLRSAPSVALEPQKPSTNFDFNKPLQTVGCQSEFTLKDPLKVGGVFGTSECLASLCSAICRWGSNRYHILAF